MKALTYTTKTAAEAAQAEIATKMGLGLPGNVTTRWADPVKIGSKWLIAVPESRFTAEMVVKEEEIVVPEVAPVLPQLEVI